VKRVSLLSDSDKVRQYFVCKSSAGPLSGLLRYGAEREPELPRHPERPHRAKVKMAASVRDKQTVFLPIDV
ncbi:hypothetical protein scyTo_0020028, partial [Scyliorhinus torazame]|nr:hypothetical protein [Scyliorhinus torazame]